MPTFAESPYIAVNDLQSVLGAIDNKFSVLTLNIQSLNAKFDNLCAFLSFMNNWNFSFTAICLQETWLSEDSDISRFIIPGYQLIHQGHICSTHAGLIIYLKEGFSYTRRNIYRSSHIWEGLFIDIASERLEKRLTLGNIYRPPRNNYNNSSIESFLQEIHPIVTILSNENTNTILSGDYNINLLEINDRVKYQEYLDLFFTLGLFPKIVLPTRFSNRKGTLIDQIYCKFSGTTQNSQSGIILTTFSDHLPCFTCIDLLEAVKVTPRFIKINNNDEASYNKFCAQI